MHIEFINVNNGVRRYWDAIYDYLEENYDECELPTIVNEQLQILKESNYKFYKLLISIMFVDHYKLLYFNDHYAELSLEDQEILEFYNSLENIDELLELFDYDDTILNVMMCEGLNYGYYDDWTKREVMTEVIPKDRFLFNMCPTHLFDKIEILKPYTAEGLLYFYKDYTSKFGNDAETKNNALESILVTMESLYTYNKDNYEEVLTDMLAVYYKWKKYLGSEPKYNMLINYEKELLDIIEKQPMINIVELSNQMPLVLDEIVDTYLYYSSENIEISNEVVDEYIKNNVDESVKAKLKLNRPKTKSLDF
ncbi:MAG: hypothetical protein PHD10_04270 [Bacilli bacterium]|nr:hypothetical protein [Bacilli bacterium]